MKFAEIEIEPNPDHTAEYGKALRFFSAITPPQPVAQRADDPVRQRFFEMRSLASDRPFARDDSELFFRQAKFMEDYTDDFEGDAKLQMYFPYYQHMGYEQLRTYFAWRTKVRGGEMAPTYVSYIFLYVYELLSGIGAANPPDGLGKLVEVWNSLLKYAPALEGYLPKWLKDFHVYYELPFSFCDFVKEHGMQKYYPGLFMFNEDTENLLEVWNAASNYDVTESVFYKAGNEKLLAECFNYVAGGIRKFCGSLRISYDSLFIYQYGRSGIWNPFRQALFYPRGWQADRKVDLLGVERYQCRNSRWSASLPIYYSDREQVVGHILKKTESCLRLSVKYKYKLRIEPYAFYRSSGTPIYFDQVIEKAVADFCREQNRTVVTIDHRNIARIREEALGTLDKLSVEYDDERKEESGERKEESGERREESGERRETRGEQKEERQIIPDSPWSALKDALTETELKALSVALHDGIGVKAFADGQGIMLEVLADGINEKAADCVGDNILEVDGGVTIYSEYMGYIEEMVRTV